MIGVEIIENFGNVQIIIIVCDVVDEVRWLGGLCAEQRHCHCWKGGAKILLLYVRRISTVVYVGNTPWRCWE